jgi:hypothetical protein
MSSGGRECSGRRSAIGKDDMASDEILPVGVAALYCLPRVDGVDRAEGSSNTRAPQWRAAMVRLGSCSGVAVGCPLGAAALADGEVANCYG